MTVQWNGLGWAYSQIADACLAISGENENEHQCVREYVVNR